MNKEVAYISEIFSSIQGEGILAGLPFVFVRFCGCNLRCNYCDTKYSWKNEKYCNVSGGKRLENPISLSNFENIIKNFDFSHLSFTGGEPLLYSEFIESSLDSIEKKILIETNGTLKEKISNGLLERMDYWSVDIKLPSLTGFDSFDDHSAFLNRLSSAKGQTIIKVVFSTKTPEDELLKSFELSKEFYKKNNNMVLIFQPLTRNSKIRITEKHLDIIFNIMKDSEFEVRIIPQIHKILRIK